MSNFQPDTSNMSEVEKREAEGCTKYMENQPTGTDAELMQTGGIAGLIEWRGSTLSYPFTYELDRLEKFQARADDIYVVSMPRSGTTWTQEIVHTLLRLHLTDEQLDAEDMMTVFPFLETTSSVRAICSGFASSITHAEQLKSPRTIKSHLAYDSLPDSVTSSGARLIYVCRNPKDMAVGYWHFQQLWPWTKMPKEYTFQHFLKTIMEGKVMYAPLFPHLLGFWKRRNDPNVLFLKYEDMKKDLPKEIRRIAKFIGIETLSDSQVERVVERSSMKGMRERMRTSAAVLGKDSDEFADAMIRKGIVGDWKNKIAEDDPVAIEYEQWIHNSLKGTGLDFNYE